MINKLKTKKTLRKPPEEWKCGFLVSRIPKNASPYLESFELPLEMPIEHWGQDYTPRGPLSADVEAAFTGERILVRLTVRAEFSVPCSRCLRETGLAIIGSLRYLFTLCPSKDSHESEEPDEPGDGFNSDDGDVDVIAIDVFQLELDMSQYVWEVLLLNLPERTLCSESCLGLCSVCGRDRNEGGCECREDYTDPRFAALRDVNL
ncbi:MAG: DUF177 domain-containing protein [Synergistaceae bacterium]|nr:DUF177 domain-containing protein [Synergistaceae bacterium]